MDAEDEQSLEERLRAQNNSTSSSSSSNKPIATRTSTSTSKPTRYMFKDEKVESHTDKNGVCYRVGDHVYLETNKQAEPYSIACILDFRLTRKDHVMLEVRWYYRPAEIPPNLYHLLIEDRYHENQGNHQTSSIKDKQTKDSGIIQDPNIIGRELFVSEIKEYYPATHIKGRCRVAHYQDIEEARAFKPDPDTFFYILTYNPEARRLANTQGEIRVGPSHQAKLPVLKSFPSSSLTNGHNDDLCSLREELLWKNKTSDIDLSTYLQAARSIAAFAGMCDRGLPEDMYEVAQRDDTTINALNVLHNHDYDCKRAIQALVKCPIPKGIDRKWSDDDQKKFIKGLRQYGKNFYRIRKEHLPHKETSDLVEFYYLWKKTPQAQSSRPRRRQRPCSTSVNLSTTPTPAKQRNAKNSNKDESEHNSDNDDNATTDSDDQTCRHCQTVSKDLQSGGRDSQLLCYDCRMYFKKYGEMPLINQETPPYLFKPLNEPSPSGSGSKRKRSKQRQSPPPPPPPAAPSSTTNSATSTPGTSSTNTSSSTVDKSDDTSTSAKTSSMRNKKKTRGQDQQSSVKQDPDQEIIKDEPISNSATIKLEEQENEKPSNEQSETSSTLGSDFPVKSDDTSSSTSAVSNTQPPLSLLIASTGSVKLELNQSASSPSGISSNGAAKVTNKILIDHTKQNNSHSIISPSSTVKSEPGTTIDSSSGYPNTLQSGLLSSPRSAFSRTSKTTTSQGFHHSPNQRSVIKDDNESPSSNRTQSYLTNHSQTSKSATMHPTILSGDVTSTAINPPVNSSNDGKATDQSNNNDMNDDDEEYQSDGSVNDSHERHQDEGPSPTSCEKECYRKPQGIVLLKVYDRSKSQNTCARTDIILKHGSRAAVTQSQKPTSNNVDDKPEIPPTPLPSASSANNLMMGLKSEERSLPKMGFPLDKGPLMHPPAPPTFPSMNHHHDPLLLNRPSPIFPGSPLHPLGAGPKPSMPNGPPPLNLPLPFVTPHHEAALRHLDPLNLRAMNPSSAGAAAHLFSNPSPFGVGMGRPNPGAYDLTAAFLLDPRYRGMMPSFPGPGAPPIVPPSPSANNSSSNNPNSTHNHSHIHSHSHTHVHLGNANDSGSSSSSNGPSLQPPPPSMMPFGNPLSSLSHGVSLLHQGGVPPPSGSSVSNLEAIQNMTIQNMTRDRDMMAFMLSGGRIDPMALVLANSLQMPRHDDLSRLNSRERAMREHNENEFRRLNMDLERQHLRFPFHHQSDDLHRRF